MLSKIGDFINPLLSKGDTVEKPDEKSHDKGGSHKKDDTPAEENNDDTFFSIEAIRALLKQENVDIGADVMAGLDLLQRYGVTSIPIRNGQPILEAITDAAALLKDK